ncbi:MAG: response regulator, partial [Pyrinomonadaceae bacterium]|nr:response regulator [Pyrinomonadaceae bacterium]
LFMQAPAAICTLRAPRHIFEIANPLYVQLVGRRDASDLIGKSIREAMPELEGQGIFKLLDKVYRTGEPFIGNEVSVKLDRRGDGTLDEGFFNFVYQPSRDARGEIDGILVHAVEVTEQVRARQRVEETNRLKDEFLATVSHELRTPLTAIIGWSSLLRSGKLDETNSANALETIERNGKAQSQLIEDLMDVSRVITGKMRLDVHPVELIPIVEAAVDAVSLAAEAKEIRLQTLLDPAAGPISGDPARLQQIIWNLLSNAIKFTPKRGRVQLRLERVNSHIEIVVSDTGQGVSPEFLPFVFDRFRQADGATTRAHGGLGLGLAIVRHLVELHGGTVRVDSPGDGQGATFTVSLPLMIVHRAPDGEERRHPKAERAGEMMCPPELDGLRVLVVDDEPDARELLTVVLAQCGAEVTTAASVLDALAALEESRPDVIVSDIGMPEEDGYSLIRQIRALPDDRGGRIPAAALTAYAGAEDRKRALLAGFQLHIPKPVEPTELVAVVATLAGRTGRA